MINKVHERALRLILNDHTSDFDTVLQSNNDSFSQYRSIQTLMVEIYKIKNDLNLLIMNFIFDRRNNMYNLSNFQELASKRKRAFKIVLETLNYRYLQLRSLKN